MLNLIQLYLTGNIPIKVLLDNLMYILSTLKEWVRKFEVFGETVFDSNISQYEYPNLYAKSILVWMKKKARENTLRKIFYCIGCRIEKLNLYLTSWCEYLVLTDTHSIFNELDEKCLWKKSRARVRNLIKLNVPYGKVYKWR